MAQWRQGDYVISENRLRNGDKVIPIWVPKGGQILKPFPAVYHSMHRLTDIAEVTDLTPEFVNERDLFQVGMERSTVNDGVSFSLSLSIEGNALETKAALLGEDLHDYPALREGQTVSAAGHFFLLSATPAGVIQFSTVLQDCEVKLTDVPGATDGQSQMTIEITTRATVFSTTAQLIPIREIWFDGTSPKDGTTAIVNAAAPDGVNTTYKLGSGNGTGLTDTPLAVAFDKDNAGSAQEYIMEYRVNGTVSTSFTYNSATGVITPSATLADGDKLEVVYFVRAGALPWDNEKSYGVGEIVAYNNSYFQSLQASTGVTPVVGVTWAAYDGFGQIAAGGTGVGTPLIPYASGVTSMFEGWNDLLLV